MNRKWLWASAVAVAVALTGGNVWYFGVSAADGGERAQRPAPGQSAVAQRDAAKNDGNAEASEPPIEPLVVNGGWPARETARVTAEAAPPVYWTAGMTQPPRPDAAPGGVPRMAGADEAITLPWPFDVLGRLLTRTLAELAQEADAAEEAEPREPMPPAAMPMLPPTDYHHSHCPYLNGQYPYRR